MRAGGGVPVQVANAAMRLARVDQTLEECEVHLTATGSFGTPIENLLTRSLLVLMCAEFEQEIERSLEERFQSIQDAPVREFLASSVDAVFRSVKSSEMSGLLKRFGSTYKERFNAKADANPVAVTYYNNIVTNRHGIAHTQGGNVTFKEAKAFYEEGHVVLDFFREALLSEGVQAAVGE
jgi:hypothetical protein